MLNQPVKDVVEWRTSIGAGATVGAACRLTAVIKIKSRAKKNGMLILDNKRAECDADMTASWKIDAVHTITMNLHGESTKSRSPRAYAL
jgi:hypothetical protein